MPREVKLEVVRRVGRGERWCDVAALFGVSVRSIARVMVESGGMPARWKDRSPRRLSVGEREEISRGLIAGDSLRVIAARLGRHPSTVSREVGVNGGRDGYRAWRADRCAWERARRPKLNVFERRRALARFVENGLAQRWSPQQIAATLVVEFPDDEEMRVSHETIYRALFVQGRGGLRKELAVCLRSGRTRRRPQRRGSCHGGGPIADMVMISERPADVEDRAVPGHWEGDLIIGRNGKSQIGTLVERTTRFTMLVALPNDRTAETVAAALQRQIATLPAQLCRSITWDQGPEMAAHTAFTIATGIPIYFCDPHTPWMRGTNENTNGLLRQYFPKGTDLSVHTQADLDRVAAELNGRPRQTLGWMKPSQALSQLVATNA